MATIKVMNASQVNPEAPVEIKLGVVNEPDKPIQYVGIPGPQGKPGKDGATGPRGPKGDTPVKGVDYFTQQDIAEIVAQVSTPEVDLTDYASKSYVETAIRGAETGLLKRSVVQSLPQSEIDDNTIYMVPNAGGASGNSYDEYLYINNTWEHIGSTEVDLTDYITRDELLDEETLVKRTDEDIPANVVILTSTRDLTQDELTLINSIRLGVLSPDDYQFIIDGIKICWVGVGPTGSYSWAQGEQPICFVYNMNRVRPKPYYGIQYGQRNLSSMQVSLGYGGYQYFPGYTRLRQFDGGNSFGSTIGVYDVYVGDNDFAQGSTSSDGSLYGSFRYIQDYFLRKADASTQYMIKDYLTNSDILAIWNGNNN